MTPPPVARVRSGVWGVEYTPRDLGPTAPRLFRPCRDRDHATRAAARLKARQARPNPHHHEEDHR